MDQELDELTVRQLRFFVAVADARGYRKAADLLPYNESTLSEQISHLERKVLRFQLFDRTGREIKLTHAGAVFLEDVRIILQQTEQAIHTAQRVAAGKIGRLRLGFAASGIYGILPAIMRAYRVRYPEVEVVLQEVATASQGPALRNGIIDAAIMRSPLHDGSLRYLIVQREPLLAVLPNSHRMAQRPLLVLHDLRDEPFVIVTRSASPGYHEQVLALCRQAGFKPRIDQEAIQVQTIVGLVAAGWGVALVPETVRSLRTAGVTYIPLDLSSPGATLELAWLRDATSPILTAFIDLVKEFNLPDPD